MRYLYAVAGTLFYLGGLRLLFAPAAVALFVAGVLDFFLFHNRASGSVAAVVGLMVLSGGYILDLWVGDVVTEARDERAPRRETIPLESPRRADQPFDIMQRSKPQPRSQTG